MGAREFLKHRGYLVQEAAKILEIDKLSDLKKLSDDQLWKIIVEEGSPNKKKGGTVSRKRGSKIMQGYKAGGKV